MNNLAPAFRSRLIAGILFLVLFSGCMPSQGTSSPPTYPFEQLRTSPWDGTLRALDPVDTSTPAHDMTAVYLRTNGDDLQIRIDLLDFQNPNDLSLDFRIEDDSKPEAVPLEIHIPSENNVVRIYSDPQLATVIVDFPLSEIPFDPRINISTPEDEISSLTLDDPVPTQRVPLLLTFYNTFTGRFPAEALRSWDGAHSGPRGERHGLKHLLDAVEEYQVPVVLLDLKEPENLSALDAMGVLPGIKTLTEEGLLILPENETLLNPAAGTPPRAKISVKNFGLSNSPFSFANMMGKFQFVFLEDRNHLYRPLFSKDIYLPIAAETESTQPTPNGPSLEVRRALLETALNADEKDLLVLGGNLQNTTWGSPDMVGPTLAYFASRPYIDILSSDELLNFPTKSGKPEILPNSLVESVSKLQSHYNKLTQPVLEYAENWKGSPISTCGSDIDTDGQKECTLARNNYLAILDPQGARLTYLFSRDGSNLHQLIGPSWQVAVGLSDPSTWDSSAGEAADPGAYPGAFTEADDPFKLYTPNIEDNALIFTSLDGTRVKTFKLTESGIEVEYQTQESVTTQIPLLVDPDSRFTPGWAENYVQENTPNRVVWGLENGPMASIHIVPVGGIEVSVKMRAFNESIQLLATPEDPDFNYPAGHYLPFPMAVAEITLDDGTFTIQLDISP